MGFLTCRLGSDGNCSCSCATAVLCTGVLLKKQNTFLATAVCSCAFPGVELRLPESAGAPSRLWCFPGGGLLFCYVRRPYPSTYGSRGGHTAVCQRRPAGSAQVSYQRKGCRARAPVRGRKGGRAAARPRPGPHGSVMAAKAREEPSPRPTFCAGAARGRGGGERAHAQRPPRG